MLQYSAACSNAALDAVEATIGASPILRIRTGAPPANVAAASTGTVLATVTLPADWMAAAANFSKAKLGTWEDLAADAAGTAGHFEIVASNGTTRHMQGTCGLSGSGADMILDNATFAAGQQFAITAFTLNQTNQ